MKHLTLCLAMILLAAKPSLAEADLRVRYSDPTSRMSLTLTQDITVVRQHPIHAARDFAFDLTLQADAAAAVTVTIDSASGSYEAHGQKMRLGTRHLTGASFPLSIGEGGRRIDRSGPQSDPKTDPVIDLGRPVARGLSIADLLTDAMPLLPATGVEVGTAWTTERTVHCLEGWVWNTGQLKSRHRVTALERQEGRTIVTVATEAGADLRSDDGEKPSTGKLERTLHWTFDATAGRVLSLTMEQDTEGVSTVPQGEIRIRQHTVVEWAPRPS